MLWHQRPPSQAMLDAHAQGVGGARFAVDHVDLVRCLGQGAQPGFELIGVGVGRC